MRKLLPVICMLWATAAAQTTETVYRTKGDTLQNFYTTLLPATPAKGLLVILGGFCAGPDQIMRETKLPEEARKAGYTVVMPYLLDDCSTIDTANRWQQRLETLIPELIRKYKTPAGKFIIGGQSMGGHRALYYAEQAYKQNNTLVKPAAVFGVDPPLDFKRLWTSFTYNMSIKFSAVSMAESGEMLRRFTIIYGGSPAERPAQYEAASSFYADAPNGGNTQYLQHIPVRLYCDPDINWVIENRRGSVTNMNLTDLSGCIARLRLLGNTQAELVTCLGKGFKPDGSRHPHYFSMLDPSDFIIWADKIISSY